MIFNAHYNISVNVPCSEIRLKDVEFKSMNNVHIKPAPSFSNCSSHFVYLRQKYEYNVVTNTQSMNINICVCK